MLLLKPRSAGLFYVYPEFVIEKPVCHHYSNYTEVGIFFGWYPARKASLFKPIDALRFQ